MRRSPLRRGAPLERRTRLIARRATPRRSDRVHDPEFLAIVRTLPCAGAQVGGVCYGAIEADHQGERPYGRKADDNTAVPMCRDHHRWRTDAAGPFKGWDKARMRAWCDEQIAATRPEVECRRAGGAEVVW